MNLCVTVALLSVVGAAAEDAPTAEDLAGEYDCEPVPGCDPAGSAQKLFDPYLVTTTWAHWKVATSDDGITLKRLVSSSGTADIPREGAAAGSRWDPWTSSQETSCLCRPARNEEAASLPPGALACACALRSRSSQYTVRIANIDSTYPETDSTREAKGALERLPSDRLAVTIEGVRRVLRRP